MNIQPDPNNLTWKDWYHIGMLRNETPFCRMIIILSALRNLIVEEIGDRSNWISLTNTPEASAVAEILEESGLEIHRGCSIQATIGFSRFAPAQRDSFWSDPVLSRIATSGFRLKTGIDPDQFMRFYTRKNSLSDQAYSALSSLAVFHGILRSVDYPQRRLIAVLNSLYGIQTTTSCSGHSDNASGLAPHIAFASTPEAYSVMEIFTQYGFQRNSNSVSRKFGPDIPWDLIADHLNTGGIKCKWQVPPADHGTNHAHPV